jgi:UDP-glucuronate 4-epimerase
LGSFPCSPYQRVRHTSELLEELLGRPAKRIHGGEQAGDVPATHADTADLESAVDFTPAISIEDGLARFTEWLRDYVNRG